MRISGRKRSIISRLSSSGGFASGGRKEKYGVSRAYSYNEYDSCLKSGEIDAVYIALPNSLHCEFAVQLAIASLISELVTFLLCVENIGNSCVAQILRFCSPG